MPRFSRPQCNKLGSMSLIFLSLHNSPPAFPSASLSTSSYLSFVFLLPLVFQRKEIVIQEKEKRGSEEGAEGFECHPPNKRSIGGGGQSVRGIARVTNVLLYPSDFRVFLPWCLFIRQMGYLTQWNNFRTFPCFSMLLEIKLMKQLKNSVL